LDYGSRLQTGLVQYSTNTHTIQYSYAYRIHIVKTASGAGSSRVSLWCSILNARIALINTITKCPSGWPLS